MKKQEIQRLVAILGGLEANIHNDRNPDQKTDSMKLINEAKEICNNKLFKLKP